MSVTSSRFYPEFHADFARILEAASGQKIAVVGHARPDGDCIGAQVALARVLVGRTQEVICVNPDPVPRRLKFLLKGAKFLRTAELLRENSVYTAIFVDCADHGRVSERLKAHFSAPLGNIDHHLSNGGYAKINLVDGESAATCEILAGMMLDQGLEVDSATAEALYTGILTDTGQFRFPSTSRRCFELAAELVSRGAVPAEAATELYERESLGKMQLLQRFLATLRLECGGRVCVGTLPEDAFAVTGTTQEDTEGLVDYTRIIDGVDIGVLIEDRKDGTVKASLRAKDPVFRLDLVAARFNGGGHACAAGLNFKHAPPDFRTRLIAALGERIAEVDAAKKKKPA